MRLAVKGLLPILGLSAVVLGCEPEEPKVSRSAFPVAMSDAVCGWIFGCCDAAERKNFAGNGQDLTSCRTQLTEEYQTLFTGVGDQAWDGGVAQGLIDAVNNAAEECPRTFDPAEELNKRDLVDASKGPGDLCTISWDCSTHFCKSGVCANPLPAESPCSTQEPCAQGLRCIQGTCKTLQPDGAQCSAGSECFSGACGGGQCVVAATYTCDGK